METELHLLATALLSGRSLVHQYSRRAVSRGEKAVWSGAIAHASSRVRISMRVGRTAGTDGTGSVSGQLGRSGQAVLCGILSAGPTIPAEVPGW